MPIYTFDTETYKWNSKKQIYEPNLNYDMNLCSVYDGKNYHNFTNKDDIWNFFIKEGKKHKKNKNLLTLYAHNAGFDFYKIIKEKYMKNMNIYCTNPFIGSYIEDGKEIFKILDSMGIFKMSLKSIGETINQSKLEMPEDILKDKPRFQQDLIIKHYCNNDCLVIYKALEKIKEMVHKFDTYIRRYITINQISNSIMLNEFSKLFIELDDNPFFFDNKRKKVIQSENHLLIKKALRGGKCEAFKTGKYNNINGIDINSEYIESAINMNFPDLRTEKYLKEPNKYGNDYLNKIGISKVMIKNISDEYGFIGVRTTTDNHYLRPGQIGIGTWTNQELKYAIENGYTIINCEFSIVYDTYKINPYSIILPKIYEMKKLARQKGNKFEEFFYKGLALRSFGKLGQYKPYQQFKMINIEDAQKYIKNNWEMVAEHKYSRLIKHENEIEKKSYYAPLIISYINGKARIIYHKEMKKIPIKNLYYGDTDSIYTDLSISKIKELFNIGEEVGQFKIEYENETIDIKGRKTYKIGKEMKVSGFYKSDLNENNWNEGKIISKTMNTIKTESDISKWGTFSENIRDLNLQQENYEKVRKMYNEEIVLIDIKEETINFFYDDLIKIVS